MSDYELVLQYLCEMFKETFGVSAEQIESNLNTPVCSIIHSPNAHDFLYFLLEISRKFHISLSNDMMENCMKWSLHDFVLDVMNCKPDKVE